LSILYLFGFLFLPVLYVPDGDLQVIQLLLYAREHLCLRGVVKLFEVQGEVLASPPLGLRVKGLGFRL
jgi:hypothetical protein